MSHTPPPSSRCQHEGAPSEHQVEQEMPSLPTLKAALRNFISPTQTTPAPSFKIIHTFPPHLAASPTRTLHILDSSFNPPTLAHLRICLSALQSPSTTKSTTTSTPVQAKEQNTQLYDQTTKSHETKPQSAPKRLLLLLATQNADKATTEAAFEHRLGMMGIMAEEIRQQYRLAGSDRSRQLSQSGKEDDNHNEDAAAGEVVVDIAVTKHARFVDKIEAIEQCGSYHPGTVSEGLQQQQKQQQQQQLDDDRHVVKQIHLIGFDTLTRLLDTKYYPPMHTLQPLQAMFERHRVRVTRRVDGVGDGRQQQQPQQEKEEQAKQTAYLDHLARGDRESEGARREWAERIDLVEGRRDGEVAVSSTKVRDAVRRGDVGALRDLVPLGIQEWISREGLYQDRT